MDGALASLERGVQALFMSALPCTSSHPLCECRLEHAPGSNWRALRQFPVLTRHVLRQYSSLTKAHTTVPETPQKKKKKKKKTRRTGLPSSDEWHEYKSLCLASLCLNLAQCHVFHCKEREVGELVVTLESFEVLERVICGPFLPLKVRLLLLTFALLGHEATWVQEESSNQQWLARVCEKIREEVVELLATGAAPRAKRLRSHDNRQVSSNEELPSCAFCRYGATKQVFASSLHDWPFLLQSTQQVAQALEKAGHNYVTNPALRALAAFWNAIPTTGGERQVTMKTSGKRKKREREMAISEEEEKEEKEKDKNVEISSAQYQAMVEKVLEGFNSKLEGLWKRIWLRERTKDFREPLTLLDVVFHCATVDSFAQIPFFPAPLTSISHLPGFCVLTEVLHALSVPLTTMITTFYRVISTRLASPLSFPAIPASTPKLTSTKRMVQAYLSTLLTSKFPVQRGVTSTTCSELDLLSMLVTIFTDLKDEEEEEEEQLPDFPRCFPYWDACILDYCVTSEEGDEGMAWCLFLEKSVLELGSSRVVSSCVRRTVENYCHVIIIGILRTSGAVISSGGTLERALIRRETDRSRVCHVLATMMQTFQDQWTIHLIVHVLQRNWCKHRSLTTFVFPALLSSLQGSMKREKAPQEAFEALIQAMYGILTGSLGRLLFFCQAWDEFHHRSTTLEQNWGFQALRKLQLAPELLEYYSKPQRIKHEGKETLQFAIEVLQSASTCSSTLESTLLNVIASMKARVDAGDEELPLDTASHVLVGHSNPLLERFLRAVQGCVNRKYLHHVMCQLKAQSGTFPTFQAHFQRWFMCLETHGVAFAGKEMRVEVARLVTRLVRWFPREFEPLRVRFLTSLDGHLVVALKAFVKEAAGRSTSLTSLTTSTASAVRVDMAVHLYLSTSTFPDLETLTILLLKATIKCRSIDAFHELVRVVSKHRRLLVPDLVQSTLSSPLRGVAFDFDCGLDSTRRAKAWIYQEKTLAFLASAASIFNGDVSWSSVLFNGRSAIVWLPYLFQYVLEMTGRAEMLLNCMETVQTVPQALDEAYWLAALLNTAVLGCSQRMAGSGNQNGMQYNRLRGVTKGVLEAIAIEKEIEKEKEKEEEDELDDAIVGVFKGQRAAKLRIQEDRTSWWGQRLLSDKVSESFRLLVASAWNVQEHEGIDSFGCRWQLLVPFSHWFASALVYSQSFHEETSALMRQWDRLFTSYVTDVYLPVEFQSVTSALLNTWITTWLTSNLARGHEELPLLALLPSQVALFRRLAFRGSAIWPVVFAALQLDVQNKNISETIELIGSTLTTLDVVELSAASDFHTVRDVSELEAFFHALETFLAPSGASALQVYYLLQYPLELLVCWYACKIPNEAYLLAHQVLERVKKVLFEKLQDKQERKSPSTEEEGKEKRRRMTSAEATEMEAFVQFWTEEMLLKYDYVNRMRCVEILDIIQAALMPPRRSLEPREVIVID